MATRISAIRKAVRRETAEQLLLISLVSFGATIILTRLFLELTGYPRIETGTLHIAHVLWGGLFLFVAALLPLIFANRWALFWSALLSGVGFGLFMDEVGKFITQTNDYFYPPAAPIIYAVFLLVVLVYLQVRRPKKLTPREELYRVLHQMEELLDNDLEEDEKTALQNQLIEIEASAEEVNLKNLAHSLADFIESDQLQVVKDRESRFSRLYRRLSNALASVLTRARFRILLILGLGANGIYSLVVLFYLIQYAYRILHGNPATPFFNPADFPFINSPIWILIRFGVQGAVGLCFTVAAILLVMERDHIALIWATLGLTISLTVVNILVFYLDQFSATIGALLELLLLLGVAIYRRRFLPVRPTATYRG